MNDTQRLDWLEEQFGCALVNDDNGHWALVFDGIQNLPVGKRTQDIASTFYIEKKHWRQTVRKAIDRAMRDASHE